MASVLVTDGEQRAALAVVRSLGRAGHHITVCSARPPSLAGASRFAQGDERVPDPLEAPADHAAAVAQLARDRRIDIVIPMGEASLLAVLSEPDAFRGITVPFPDLDRFRRVSDKAAVTAAARRHGIAVPAQQVLAAPDDAVHGSIDGLRFPLVLKPSRSVVDADGSRKKTAVIHAPDRSALDAALSRLPAAAYPVLLQERITGPGIGIFLLLWEGEVLAAFAHRRIREKPPSGGVSVYRESADLDPSLLGASRGLLDEFGWQGVAMIEYKLDRHTGTPYLMEINGRFWGSLQLAIDAGVDFPALLVAVATGRSVAPVTRYRTGVRSRWWWGDVDHLLLRLLRTGSDATLPADAPGRMRAVLDFLAACGPASRSEVFRLSDPRPAIRETIDWFRRR